MKKIYPILELISKNLFWYLVFSIIYLNSNPLDWWLVQNVWGRVILIVLEIIIINSTFLYVKNNETE